MAGLVADRVTEVYDIEHIDRGYPDFLAQLRSLGGEIRRVSGWPETLTCAYIWTRSSVADVTCQRIDLPDTHA